MIFNIHSLNVDANYLKRKTISSIIYWPVNEHSFKEQAEEKNVLFSVLGGGATFWENSIAKSVIYIEWNIRCYFISKQNGTSGAEQFKGGWTGSEQRQREKWWFMGNNLRWMPCMKWLLVCGHWLLQSSQKSLFYLIFLHSYFKGAF